MLALSRRTWQVTILIVLIILSSQHKSTDAASTFTESHSVPLSTTSINAAMAASLTSDALIEAKHILRSTYEDTVTQADVTRRLEGLMRSEGADGALSFPTLVMSGSELVFPHGDPLDDEVHVINPSTEPIVMIDIGCKYRGHTSDVTRTFFFESATQEMLDTYSDVLAAQEAIIEAIGPGVAISDLDAIMRSHLSDYYSLEGVTVIRIWGHGVGQYVHELPYLFRTAGTLVVGDVLAIEPGIYFDDGWAVRVEDTVLVTETGVEVLSNVSKSLDDVKILQSQPVVTADLSILNYDYNHMTTARVSISDSAFRDISNITLFNGYSWMPMVREIHYQYRSSYSVNYSYSGLITIMVRIDFSNDTYYFNRLVSADAEPSSTSVIYPEFQVDSGDLPSPSPLMWTFAQAGAKMIRIHFEAVDGGWNQLLVLDSASRMVIDYSLCYERFIWSPWVAGDTLSIHVVATEPEELGEVDPFSFIINAMDFVEEDIPTSTTTTTTTTTTPPPTTSTIDSTTESSTPSTSDIPTTAQDLPMGQTLMVVSSLAAVVIVLALVRSKVKDS